MNSEAADRLKRITSIHSAAERLRAELATYTETAADAYEVEVIDTILARQRAKIEQLAREIARLETYLAEHQQQPKARAE